MGGWKVLLRVAAIGLVVTSLGRPAPAAAQAPGAAYIVRLREQADLAAVEGDRPAVEALLRAVSERTQAPLLARLAQWRRQGKLQDFRSLWIVNAITLRAPAEEVLEALRADPAVATVAAAAPVAAPPTRVTRTSVPRGRSVTKSDGLVKIGAEQLWARATPVTGAGVRVGIIDTGVDASRAPFGESGKIAAWMDFVNGQGAPYDDETYGHGTHVAGTIAGASTSGYVIGVAPSARLIVAKALNAGKGGEMSTVLAAAQWVLDPDGNANTDDGADVVNCSLGAYPHDNTQMPELKQMVEVMRAANVFPCFAIGNSGPGASTTASPGDYPNAVGVGATDNTDNVASFSSRGPVVWSGFTYTKPDVCAPGVNILSCVPLRVSSSGYACFEGTSMAAPHLAGAVALAIGAARARGFTPTVESLLAALKNTAVKLGAGTPNNSYGYGRVNAVAFVDAVAGNPPAIGKPALLVPAASAILRDAPAQMKVKTTVTGGALLKYRVTITRPDASIVIYDQTTAAGAAAFDRKAQPYLSGQTAAVTVAALPTGAYSWTASATSDDGATWIDGDTAAFIINRQPAATAVSPADAAVVSTGTPTFTATVVDADAGETLKVRVTLRQEGAVVRTFDQTTDATGWDRASYASGETATLAVPAAQALAGGAYTWTAAASDGKEWSPESVARTLTVGQVPEAPQLLAPVSGAVTNGTPTFRVAATDADAGASLRYRILLATGAAAVTFDQVADAAGWDKASYASGETATYAVPSGAPLAPGSYTWQALAYDGVLWSPAGTGGSFTVDADVPRTLIADTLGTFGLGLNLAGATRTGLGLTGVPMKTYNPATGLYEDAPETLSAGTGYWIKPGTTVSLVLAGPPATGTARIPLRTGWNFISSPFARPVSWNLDFIQVEQGSAVTPLRQAGSLVESFAWGYVGGTGDPYQLVYQSTVSGVANQLEPWRGYWVKANADCTLLLGDPGLAGLSVTRTAASGWSVPIQVRGAEGARNLILGATSGRALAVGQPPAAPGTAGGITAGLVRNGALLAADVRSAGNGRMEWEMLVDADGGDVTIAPDLRALPKELSLTLIDTATGAKRSLRTSAGYTFRANGEERRFRLVAEKRSSAPALITDLRVVKVRSGRAVQFNLSRAASVDVELVSPTGALVATVARNRAAEAGMNVVTAAGSIQRGLYLVRVRATTDDGATVQAVRPVVVAD